MSATLDVSLTKSLVREDWAKKMAVANMAPEGEPKRFFFPQKTYIFFNTNRNRAIHGVVREAVHGVEVSKRFIVYIYIACYTYEHRIMISLVIVRLETI